jgi:ABC-type multidrug transport system fused ATPase/permease subunit
MAECSTGISLSRLEISQTFLQNVITGLQTVLVIYVAGQLILSSQGFSVGMLFSFLAFRQTFTDRSLALVKQLVEFRHLMLSVSERRLSAIKIDGAVLDTIRQVQ